jgi:hypothetical protein
VVPTPASASTAAPGGIGVRLLEVPVNAHDDPRARIYIVDHLAPGTVIRRRLEVSNTTAATTQVAMYAAAATIDKGSFLGAPGHTPNDLSTWTSVSPGASDVPTAGRVTATVTITVPTDAAPGEQYGVVWAEARAASVAQGGITQVSRVGIRLYISVGPGGPPAADFAIDSLTAKRGSDGRPIILASVRNTGGRALDMNGTLDLLAGPGGLSAGPFPATLGTTLGIGDVQPVSITLDKRLPAGPWDARITLHSGLLDRSARATVTFPETGAAPAVATTSPAPGLRNWAIVVLIALVLLVMASLFVARRRRRAHLAAADVPVLEKGIASHVLVDAKARRS